MKKHEKTIALGLSAVLALSCLAACSSSNDKEKTASTNEVSIAMSSEPANLDPSRCGDSITGQVVLEVNETLVRYDENGELKPAGAEKWEISEDGMVYTFHLRDNKYSDGTDIVAADYVNGMMRALDPEVGSNSAGVYYVIKGAEEYNSGKCGREDVFVKALDDKTLEITLTSSVPHFIQMVNTPLLSPVPESKTQGEDNVTYGSDADKMLFSGPFMVSSWERGSKIVLAKNPNYWDAENVKLDAVNCLLIQDENSRQQMFEQGEIHLLANVRQEYVDKLKGDIDSGKFTFQEMASPRISYICFNNQDPNGIFTNAKVRLAFSLAIDREEYVNQVAKKNKASYGFIPPATNNGDKKYRDMVEEPFKEVVETMDAKTVLEEGLKELGLKAEDVTVTFLQANSNPDTKISAEYFQNQWQEKLGVKVVLESAPDNATFNANVGKGFYQVCNTGWGADYNDPMTFMQMYVTGDGNNAPFASNARYDELVTDCLTEMDMDVRAEKFAEAEKICIVDEAFIAPLTYAFNKNLSSGQLKGYAFNSAGGPDIELKTAHFEG